MSKSRQSPRHKARGPARTRKRTTRKRAKPDSHPIARLSFVASRDGKTLPLATKEQDERCYWHVKPTGDYAVDCVTGEKLALEYLEYEAKRWPMGILQQIVLDMPRRPQRTGIEIGFLSTVAYAAGAGVQSARDLAAYYDRCRGERAAKALNAKPGALRRNVNLLKSAGRKGA